MICIVDILPNFLELWDHLERALLYLPNLPMARTRSTNLVRVLRIETYLCNAQAIELVIEQSSFLPLNIVDHNLGLQVLV